MTPMEQWEADVKVLKAAVQKRRETRAAEFLATCKFCGDEWPANDGRWTGERFDCGQCVRGMSRTGGN